MNQHLLKFGTTLQLVPMREPRHVSGLDPVSDALERLREESYSALLDSKAVWQILEEVEGDEVENLIGQAVAVFAMHCPQLRKALIGALAVERYILAKNLSQVAEEDGEGYKLTRRQWTELGELLNRKINAGTL